MEKSEFIKAYKEANLEHIWPPIEAHIKNSIQIIPTPTDEKNMAIGTSKFGGNPDLPRDKDWFTFRGRPMSFLAQINMADVQEFDQANQLPDKGILYFFYDSEQEVWGYDPKDKGGAITYYYDGAVSDLERKSKPEDLDEEEHFNSCALRFEAVVNMPDYQSDLFDFDLTEEDQEKLFDLQEKLYEEEVFKLLGHSNNVQGGMELECELVTNGLYCGDESGYNDPKAKALAKNIDQWQLLFQFDSSEDVGSMWGDSGRVYFWIKEEDLKKQNFGKTWGILQCY